MNIRKGCVLSLFFSYASVFADFGYDCYFVLSLFNFLREKNLGINCQSHPESTKVNVLKKKKNFYREPKDYYRSLATRMNK